MLSNFHQYVTIMYKIHFYMFGKRILVTFRSLRPCAISNPYDIPPLSSAPFPFILLPHICCCTDENRSAIVQKNNEYSMRTDLKCKLVANRLKFMNQVMDFTFISFKIQAFVQSCGETLRCVGSNPFRVFERQYFTDQFVNLLRGAN